MAYTAYELNAGDALSDVQSWCRHLTLGGSFTSATQPTLTTVERWLTLSHHFVAGLLVSAGYSATQTDTEVVGILQHLNSIDAVIKIELSHPVTGIGEPNERFMAFMTEREELIKLVTSKALETLGATTLPNIQNQLVKATGISWSEKEDLATDTDHIPHRFRRGIFEHHETIAPLTGIDTREE